MQEKNWSLSKSCDSKQRPFKLVCLSVSQTHDRLLYLHQVVKVTKVRQVESESLKKQFRDSQEEITQLKLTIERQKEDIHNSQIEVKYLQKIVSTKQNSYMEGPVGATIK